MMQNKNIIKNFPYAVGFAVAGLFVFVACYLISEPGIVGAAVDTDNVTVNLNVTGTISLNSPSDVNMSPDIAGTGASTGNVVWTVTTNNSSGWKLEVETDQANTMHSGSDIFTDYTEASEDTPETWSIAASASEFGFGATGSYIETKFGADKYMGFNSTTKEQVAHEATETSGSDTTVIFRAEVGASKFQPTGAYSSTVTATATTL
jgi:hypothetical protein